MRALSVAALALLTATAAADDGLIGRWSGTIDDAGTEIVIELARADDGSWSGTARVRSDQADPVPLDDLTVSEEGIGFSASGLTGSPLFRGQRAGDQIEGTVSVAPPPPPPATDIHLAELRRTGGSVGLGLPVNITDRDGYDNQPHFLPDGSALLYTSIRDGQADIYRWDLAAGTRSQLTDTIESEYSPTPLPSGDGFSTVRVEADGTQRLWSFDLNGREPMVMLESVAPVGYHGWLDEHRLGLFVLGSPPTLQVADVDLQSSRVVAENIGRSIHRAPTSDAVTFVSKGSEWTIELLELDGERRTLLPTRPEREDFTWVPGGGLLMGDGSSLYIAEPLASQPRWLEFANLEGLGIDEITRVDVSEDGRWLAFVAARPAAEAATERTRQPLLLRRLNDD